jgi:predicted MFS family arabinose efflux permease
VIYDLLPEARSRLTTIYMTTYFIGGAVGSAAGSQAYARGGWAAATVTAAVFPVLGLLAWLADGRHERARYHEIRTDGPSGYAPVTDSR